MFSRFFIDRPKFAIVISLVMTLMGTIALSVMPVAEYPPISPNVIEVKTFFPGASADVIRDTVAQPIESAVNGVEDMLYMSSNAGNDGSYRLNIYFRVGSDGDMAQVRVNNMVSQVASQLPAEVRQIGVTVRKKSSDMLAVVTLTSPQGTYDSSFLSNYADLNVSDRLKRVEGMSEVMILGSMDYSMRIWLDPEKMANLGVTTQDVAAAIQEQNKQVAAGKIGGDPAPLEQQFQYVLRTEGRMSDAEQFENIIIRAGDDSSFIRVKDVARVEIGSQRYEAAGSMNDSPAAVMVLYQLPDANALETMERTREALVKIGNEFPDDLDYTIAYDSTTYIKVSIEEIFLTLIIAAILVTGVTYLFLQSWRATLIPATAIPISMIATFAVMLSMGMSINTVSMFGLILAIGIVVDNAILVVENVERHMHESDMSAREATIISMKEISGPIAATTLVLLAVFVPVALLPGISGRMFNQFAVTICVSVLISAIQALTLAPAMCAAIMRKETKIPAPLRAFNTWFDGVTQGLMKVTRFFGKRLSLSVAVFLVLIGALVWQMQTAATSFVPNEDKGTYLVELRLPKATALSQTKPILSKYTQQVMALEGVKYVVGVDGFSLINNASIPNSAMMIIKLDDWSERTHDPALHQRAIMANTRAIINQATDVGGFVFATPPIRGMGAVDGISLVLQDTLGRDPVVFSEVGSEFIKQLNARPEIARAFTTFTADVPQRFVSIDVEKAKSMGISLNTIYHTLSAQLGGVYVNDFNIFGKAYQVKIQADPQFRSEEQDIDNLYVRANTGEMVPMGTLVELSPVFGPDVITRFNMFASVNVSAYPAPGYSTGDVVKVIEDQAARSLPEGYSYDWSGLTLQEIKSGNTMIYAFALAFLFTYLFLVAQYESWAIPISVMMTVPIAVLGGYLSMYIMQSPINLYTQIGLVVLMGMAAKIAILIVEFAVTEREVNGKPILESAVEAARLRFRAVVMSGFSFVVGVAPLVIASGAGAEARLSMGYAVFGGMNFSLIVGTLLTPTFFILIQRMREKNKSSKAAVTQATDRSETTDKAESAQQASV